MVVSAALLIRERGARATAIADVLQHSGAPRGSAYHHFPGGRTQLLCEAVDYAGEHIAAVITEAGSGLELLDTLIEKYRQQLLSTDFRAGCPIAAVSVEAGFEGGRGFDRDSEKQDSEKQDSEKRGRERMAPVVERAAIAFDLWCDLMSQRFIADGIPAGPARELALFATSALEGALLMARVGRNLAPLDVMHSQMRSLLLAALPSDAAEELPR
jgi:AcrR family transcriptional regulator